MADTYQDTPELRTGADRLIRPGETPSHHDDTQGALGDLQEAIDRLDKGLLALQEQAAPVLRDELAEDVPNDSEVVARRPPCALHAEIDRAASRIGRLSDRVTQMLRRLDL